MTASNSSLTKFIMVKRLLLCNCMDFQSNMKLNNRMKILEDLVNLKKPLEELSNDLKEIDWDYEGDPFLIQTDHVIAIVRKYLDGELNEVAVERWANMIECREDLDVEKSELDDVIYKLANPEINDPISRQLCEKIINDISG